MSAEDVPEILSSQTAFAGRLVTVRVDEVRFPGGQRGTREVVEHPGAVVVAALDDTGRVVLVRQYRHPVRGSLLELPAGTLEAGEGPAGTAKRELVEETGLRADSWVALGSFFSSPGFLREELHAFLARGLHRGEQDLEEDEDIELVWRDLDELLADPEDLHDAKTLATLLLVRRRLAEEAGAGGDRAAEEGQT